MIRRFVGAEHVGIVRGVFHLRVQRLEVTQPRSVEIAHHLEVAIGQGAKITHQVGTPVTAASHTESNLFIHMIASRYLN
jgi:hypothetical protein